MHSVNFGISGDTTDNVLWRLHNRELEDVAPKVSCCENYKYSDANKLLSRSLSCLLDKKTMETVLKLSQRESRQSVLLYEVNSLRPSSSYW